LLQKDAKQKFPLDFERNPLHAVHRRRNRKKMKKTNLFAVLALAATPAFLHAQTTSYSDVVGYSKISLPAGSSAIAPGFVKAAVFSGSSTITGQAFSGSFASSLNPTSFSDRPNYPTHYVEITSGAYEGYSFDVNAAGASGIQTDGIPTALNGATVSVVIRPHVTLNDLVQGQVGLVDYSDAVNIINLDGTTTTRFYAEGSWLAEDFTTPAGHTVVYPGTGLVFSAGGAQITTQGVVKPNKTVVPLSTVAVNIVGPSNPSSATLVNNLGIASSLSPYSDGFNVFSTDGNLSTVATFFSDGSGILDSGFAALDPAATDSVPSNSAIAVSVTADTAWIINSPLAP
jgi:hypothetical protein